MKENIDILLVNSPMRAYTSKERDFTAISPLGEGYIATYLNERGFKARILDAEGLVLSQQEIIDEIDRVNPRWVGFNVYSPIVNLVRGIIHEVRGKNIVVGGSHATLKPADTLKEEGIDIVARGDAEETMEEILLGESLNDIKGISYRVGGKIYHNEQRTQIQDLGKLPILDRSLFPVDPWDENGYRLSTVITSRGCSYRCTFCAGPELARRKIRFRPMESVGEEIHSLIEDQGVTFVRFMDDFFLVNEARSQQFIDVMSKRGVTDRFQWDAMVRTDAVLRFSGETMRGLKRTGALFMAIGIETGSEIRMEKIKKGITKDQVRAAVQKAVKYGIEPKGFFMIGYPGEEESEMWETINFARELRELGLTRATFNEIRPYPGTAMYNELLSEGWTEDELNAYQYVDLVRDEDDDQSKKHLLERSKSFTSLERSISHVQPQRVREILREAILEFK